MTLRRAIRVFVRPWIDGSVTFQDWLLAGAVIEAAIIRDEQPLPTPPLPQTDGEPKPCEDGYQEALHRPDFHLKPSKPWPRPDEP
jgi:hypothetical protein